MTSMLLLLLSFRRQFVDSITCGCSISSSLSAVAVSRRYCLRGLNLKEKVSCSRGSTWGAKTSYARCFDWRGASRVVTTVADHTLCSRFIIKVLRLYHNWLVLISTWWLWLLLRGKQWNGYTKIKLEKWPAAFPCWHITYTADLRFYTVEFITVLRRRFK